MMIGVYSVSRALALEFLIKVDEFQIGAYVAAPFGGIGFMFASFLVRLIIAFVLSKVAHRPFTVFDRPPRRMMDNRTGAGIDGSYDTAVAGSGSDEHTPTNLDIEAHKKSHLF